MPPPQQIVDSRPQKISDMARTSQNLVWEARRPLRLDPQAKKVDMEVFQIRPDTKTMRVLSKDTVQDQITKTQRLERKGAAVGSQEILYQYNTSGRNVHSRWWLVHVGSD